MSNQHCKHGPSTLKNGYDDDASKRFRIGPYVDWDVWAREKACVEAIEVLVSLFLTDVQP